MLTFGLAGWVHSPQKALREDTEVIRFKGIACGASSGGAVFPDFPLEFCHATVMGGAVTLQAESQEVVEVAVGFSAAKGQCVGCLLQAIFKGKKRNQLLGIRVEPNHRDSLEGT